MPAFFDRLLNYLAKDLGANRNVLVAGDDVAGTGEQRPRLLGSNQHRAGGLYFQWTSQRVQVGLVPAKRDSSRYQSRQDIRKEPAAGFLIAYDTQRFEFANIRPARRFGRHG